MEQGCNIQYTLKTTPLILVLGYKTAHAIRETNKNKRKSKLLFMNQHSASTTQQEMHENTSDT